MRLRDRAVFFRSLGTMFEAGVSLTRALDQLAEQSEDPLLRQAAQGLVKGLQAGKSLSRVMADFPWAFTTVSRRLIQAGEHSGRLAQVLLRLADNEEQMLEMSQKVKNSLVTPALVSLCCLVLVVALPPLCLRGLLTMLKETGVALPWPTRMLLVFSSLLCNGWFYVGLFALTAVAWWATRRLLALPTASLRFWQALMWLPLIGPTLRTLAVIHFGQTLASMLDSGNSLLVALPLSAQATGNPILQNSISLAVTRLTEGETLAEALIACPFFPRSFVLSLRAGEESGSVAQLLLSLVKLYRLELEQRLSSFASALEPLVMSLVGAIVGFVVVATLLPMLKVVDSL